MKATGIYHYNHTVKTFIRLNKKIKKGFRPIEKTARFSWDFIKAMWKYPELRIRTGPKTSKPLEKRSPISFGPYL